MGPTEVPCAKWGLLQVPEQVQKRDQGGRKKRDQKRIWKESCWNGRRHQLVLCSDVVIVFSPMIITNSCILGSFQNSSELILPELESIEIEPMPFLLLKMYNVHYQLEKSYIVHTKK